MSKRGQESQGGEDRYGAYSGEGQATMTDKPQTATAAQMARRKIATARKASSNRGSRATTPSGNPFAQQQQQQSMPSFQPPTQGDAGFGGGFNFTAGGGSNPFAQQSQNGTPPPTSFQFGSQAPAQQNGGSGIFGNNTNSFGSTFGSGTPQPQQNGFSFGTQNDANKNNTSTFSFGQNNQSQQNGVTPSTNASFPTFGTQANENPFKSFGQSQQPTQSTPSTSFGGFGHQSQQQNGEKTPATPSFGGFGQKDSQPQSNGATSLFDTAETPKPATGSIFSSFGAQTNGTANSFGSASQAEQTPKANTSSLFSVPAQSNTSKPLFGATPPPDQPAKSGESVIGGLDAARASTIKAGMFTSGQSETPKPSFMFGQSQQTSGGTSNMFGAASQQTSKASNGLFNFGQSQQQASTPGFKLGQSQAEDTSMTTPGSTPLKANPFAPAASAPVGNGASASNTGKSLFDRVSKDPPATAEQPTSRPFTPSTSMFTTSAPKASESNQQAAEAGSSAKSLFDRISPADQTATTAKSTTFTPSTALFNKPPEQAPSTASAAPWLSHTPSTLSQATSASAVPETKVIPPTPQSSASTARASGTTMTEPLSQSERDILQKLNTGLREHLNTQDPYSDWTSIMEYYIQEAAKIRQKPVPQFDASAPSAQKSTMWASSTPESQLSDPNHFAPSTPKAQASSTSNMFGATAPKTSAASGIPNMFVAAAAKQTPASSATSNTFSQPPATAPVSKKRAAPFEEDDSEDAAKQPATEKRAKPSGPINYPKLPENASETAKLFQATLDNAASTPQPATSSGSGGFRPSATSATSATGGVKPATSSAASGGFKPSTTPATGGSSFLAAFGQKASAEEEKERKKRKANDYDSDEETEEQWEKRDREEQEAKRQKIAEAAKNGTGFKMPGAPAAKEPETPADASKKLFGATAPPATAPSKPSMFSAATPSAEKSTASMFGSKTPAATSTSNIFGSIGTAKDQPNGSDTTWKPTTPIKFGGSAATTATESTTPAAPPPKFSNLFGATAPSTAASSAGGLLGVPSSSKPTLGFNFGGQPGGVASLSNSRATTPGVTTDGEGASTAGEEDDAAANNDPQLEDQTALLPEEKENNDVLFQVHIAKSSKHEAKNDPETGKMGKGWVEKGKGPLYILKNKESGQVRVLLKIRPLGKAAMNFNVIKGAQYSWVKGKKTLTGMFVDHINPVPEGEAKGKPSMWLLQVGKVEDAEEIGKVLSEAAKA